MKILRTIAQLQESIRKSGLSPTGLVPTMGALHRGHLSLAETALSMCPVAVVSIFVNPTQFNDKKDLQNYPRTIEADLKLLGSVLREEDIVFTPEVQEMYPEKDARIFSFGNLDMVMEAKHRPGHFNGVAQIVSKLFNAVNPDFAFFGIKDFQQLAVIKNLVKQMGSNISIVSCPIVREPDGLAMSSRNMLLGPEIRKNAPVIFRTISKAASMLDANDIPEIKEFVTRTINKVPDFSLGYFEVADDVELIPVKTKDEMIPGRKYYACIAVKAGNIRLIDNVEMKV
jgi:pantoate--beta-alanine ligase